MAQVIPDTFSSSKAIDAGSKDVLKALRDGIADTSVVVWGQPKISLRASVSSLGKLTNQRIHPDIVLYSPDHGMLVIEVKRWQIDQIVKADPSKWQIKKGREIEIHDSPWIQAKAYNDNIRQSMMKIKSLVNPDGSKHQGRPLLPVGHAVCFPNISSEDLESRSDIQGLFDHCGSYILSDQIASMRESIDGADGSRLLNRLSRETHPFRYENELTDEQMIALKGLLFPEVVAIQAACGGQFKKIALDTNQENLVRTLDGGHIFIRGVAGSGKSLILAAKARTLAEENPKWKILLTCYNVPLCKSLEFYVRSFGSQGRPFLEEKNFSIPVLPHAITVMNFHRLAASIFKEYGIKYPASINAEELRNTAQFKELSEAEFEAEIDERESRILGSTLENLILSKQGLAGRFDAIFIDEAQDFHESWLRCMTLLLKGDTNFLVLAEDPNQKIYPRKCGYSNANIKPKKRIKLKVSYRSTKSIVVCASRLVVAKAEQWDSFYKDFIEDNGGNLDRDAIYKSDGSPPAIVVNASRAEMLLQIVSEIKALVESGEGDKRYRYSDFAILYLPGEPASKVKGNVVQADMFAGQPGWKIMEMAEAFLAAEHIPSFRLMDKEERSKDHLMDNRVTLSTMGLVKGLEFEHVYLMGLENFPWPKRGIRENASYVYVGMTRARSGLLLHSTIETDYVKQMREYFDDAIRPGRESCD